MKLYFALLINLFFAQTVLAAQAPQPNAAGNQSGVKALLESQTNPKITLPLTHEEIEVCKDIYCSASKDPIMKSLWLSLHPTFNDYLIFKIMEKKAILEHLAAKQADDQKK